jgi:solute carrier family 25 folate transporter 32
MGINSHGLSTIHETIRLEGIRGVFRGWTISAFCTPFFHTLYFPLYESIKGNFKAHYGWQENSFKLYSASASIAGITCNIITNPFWVVRTRMQAEIFRSMCDKTYESKYPTNVFCAMARIQRNEGTAALYQGLSASAVGVLHPIIYFPLYEKSKIYCLKNFEPPGSEKLSHRYVMMSAIVCKAMTSLLTYPHEVVRSRQ